MAAIVLDLDGVVWLADEPIEGAAAAVAQLRAETDVCFVTNNSSVPAGAYAAKLTAHGIPAEESEVLTSALAAAELLHEGQTALVCAGPGVVAALEARGVRAVRDGPADAVVVGWHTDFDYGRLTAATSAVLGGARLIGTNDDATYPVPGGVLPGGGSILAAVAYASGITPEVAGKPHQPIVDLIARHVGEVGWVVGDRPSTDGRLARALGARFALVLSGVATGAAHDPVPDLVADDLAAAAAALLRA